MRVSGTREYSRRLSHRLARYYKKRSSEQHLYIHNSSIALMRQIVIARVTLISRLSSQFRCFHENKCGGWMIDGNGKIVRPMMQLAFTRIVYKNSKRNNTYDEKNKISKNPTIVKYINLLI